MNSFETLLADNPDKPGESLGYIRKPSVPSSGYIFAESAMKAYKAMEDSEWHRKN